MKDPIWFCVLLPLAVLSTAIITLIAIPFIAFWGISMMLVAIGVCFKMTLETICGTIEDKLS